MNNKTIIVGCDLDEAIFPLIENVLKLYNEKYNDTVKVEDITDYNVHLFLKSECRNVFKEFCTYEFISQLPISKETIETINKINEEFLLYFCTARHPYNMQATDFCLSYYFPWFKSSQLINIANKQLLKIDWLIDDSLSNLLGGDYRKILINRPWNEKYGDADNVYRAYTLQQAYKIIKNGGV